MLSPGWLIDLVLRADHFFFLRVIRVSEFSTSIAAFFAALTWEGWSGSVRARRLRPPTSSGPSVGGLLKVAPPALLLVVLLVGDLRCRVNAVGNGKPRRGVLAGRGPAVPVQVLPDS